MRKKAFFNYLKYALIFFLGFFFTLQISFIILFWVVYPIVAFVMDKTWSSPDLEYCYRYVLFTFVFSIFCGFLLPLAYKFDKWFENRKH